MASGVEGGQRLHRLPGRGPVVVEDRAGPADFRQPQQHRRQGIVVVGGESIGPEQRAVGGVKQDDLARDVARHVQPAPSG